MASGLLLRHFNLLELPYFEKFFLFVRTKKKKREETEKIQIVKQTRLLYLVVHVTLTDFNGLLNNKCLRFQKLLFGQNNQKDL